MPHITVLPASTVAGKATVRALLASESNPTVRGIYRDPSKAPAEFTTHPRFEAVQGDVGAEDNLDFTGSNAVFYIPPPTYDGRETAAFAAHAATNVQNAITRAGVKKLVLHSALGAQNDHGIGILRLNNISDEMLKASAAEVIVVRPCNYYENWTGAVKSMRADLPTFESTFSPPDFEIPMVSIKDVAAYCAKALLDEAPRPSPQYARIFGPRFYSSLDVKKALEEVTGKEGTLVTIPQEGLEEYFAKELPSVYVPDFVEFMTAQLPGEFLVGEYEYREDTVRGKVELLEGLKGIAADLAGR